MLLKGTNGTNGSDGTAGKHFTDLTEDELNELGLKLPPIYPKWVTPVGRELIDEIKGGVHLGQKMKQAIEIDVKLIEKIVSESLARQAK